MELNNNTLDLKDHEFAELLAKATELVLSQFQNLQYQKGFQNNNQAEIESWFNESLPESGMDFSELLLYVMSNFQRHTCTMGALSHLMKFWIITFQVDCLHPTKIQM